MRSTSSSSEPGWLRAPRLLLVLGLVGWLALLPMGSAQADDTELSEEEEERLEAIEYNRERGIAAYGSGNYDEALARMKRIRRFDEAHQLPARIESRVHLQRGAYADGVAVLAKALEAHPNDGGYRLGLVRFRTRVGAWDVLEDESRARLETHPSDVTALWGLGQAHEERGRQKEALAVYDQITQLYNTAVRAGEKKTWSAPRLYVVARAAERATWLSDNPADDMLNQGLRLLAELVEEDPQNLEARLAIAELYRADAGPRGQSRARKAFKILLKANTEVPDAYVGLAWTDLVFYNQSGALKNLSRALGINKNHVEALALRAAINVGNGDYDEAAQNLERALAIEPTDKYARTVKAAMLYITGETKAYEALRDAILEYDPTYGMLHLVTAELVGERQRRYDLAIEFAEKAIAVDPDLRAAYTVLGESLMNRGRTDEAREVFEKGYKVSKTYGDVRRDNWREVLRVVIPNLETIKTEHFEIRMSKSEAKVMRHYLPQLLEESWDTLTAKYGIEPEMPIYADAFDRPDDFSVRSVGSAGLPALGVCFGNVITLLGPTARPMGQFSWSRTAWHEFAHVITLRQSMGQVPRWLTEGLSVFEEQERRDRWGRDMERELHQRYHNDRLLRMAAINSAFRGPDIMFAYYQGGLIASHLQEARGFEVIPKMLRAFSEDKTTAEVFREVLGEKLADYDKAFRAYVGKIVGSYKMTPIWDDQSMQAFEARTKKDASDTEAWVRVAWGHFQRGRAIDAGSALQKARALDDDHPEVLLLEARLAQTNERHAIARAKYEAVIAMGHDNFSARQYLAQDALRRRNDAPGAIRHLEAAKACFPRAIGRSSPYLQLAQLHRGAGDLEKAMAEVEAYAAIAAEDYDVRVQIRAWHHDQKNWADLARVCEEMNDISPFGANMRQRGASPDLLLHRLWAEALAELGDAETRLRELAVQVELVWLMPEEAQATPPLLRDRWLYGQALLEAGQPLEALGQATAILRLAPDHAEAAMLKARAEEASSR